jgi:hypothetical protein
VGQFKSVLNLPEGLSTLSEGVRILNLKFFFSDFFRFFRFFRFLGFLRFFLYFLDFLGFSYDFLDLFTIFVIFRDFLDIFQVFFTYWCEKRGKYRVLLLNIHFNSVTLEVKLF